MHAHNDIYVHIYIVYEFLYHLCILSFPSYFFTVADIGVYPNHSLLVLVTKNLHFSPTNVITLFAQCYFFLSFKI
jgi:hypothetical protein